MTKFEKNWKKFERHPLTKRANKLTTEQKGRLFDFIMGYGLVNGSTVESSVEAAFSYMDSVGGGK